jgi:hypothetical protein
MGIKSLVIPNNGELNVGKPKFFPNFWVKPVTRFRHVVCTWKKRRNIQLTQWFM